MCRTAGISELSDSGGKRVRQEEKEWQRILEEKRGPTRLFIK